VERLDENIGSVALELLVGDRAGIDDVASTIDIQGARCPEYLERQTGL
jgi:hypothetical protein